MEIYLNHLQMEACVNYPLPSCKVEKMQVSQDVVGLEKTLVEDGNLMEFACDNE